MRIQSIVEGHGEMSAVPVLLRRLTISARQPVEVLRPIRRPRSTLVKQDGLQRAIELAAKYVSRNDAILVIFDADGDCPAELAPRLLAWARAARPDRRTAVVMANNEFEAWFLAAAESLAVAGKLAHGTSSHPDPESVRDAKGWLSAHMSRRYSETIDQPAFAAGFDLASGRSTPSFLKLEREVEWLLRATD
jgi:hypothetical protein